MRIPTKLVLVSSLTFLIGPLCGAPPKFAAREALQLSNAVVTLGDINGDGLLDIVAAGATPGSTNNDYQVSILLNKGSAGYTTSETVDLGPNFTPVAIVTGDFNKDGLLDIAVLSSSAQSLYVLLQQTTGFQANPIQILDSTQSTLNMVAADINGDRVLDILIPTSAGVVALFGTGSGHFQAPVLVTTTTSSYVTVKDLNGDQKADMIVSSNNCCSTPGPFIFLGDGHGGFNSPIAQPVFSSPAPRFAVADFNKDGKPDIATVSIYNGGVQIAFGNGDGTFGLAESAPLPGLVPYGLSISAGDISGDGVPDLVVLASSNNYYGEVTAVVTLINGGVGNFGVPAINPVQQAAQYVLLGNLNSDTYPDIIVASASSSVVSLLFNNGKGVFQDGILETTTSAPVYMVSGDFNGDGKLDLAEVSTTQGLTVFLNSGNNAAPFSALQALPYYTGPIVAGDFNRDGRLDLVVFNSETGQTLLGNGDGTFFFQPPSFTTGNEVGAALATDMNGDGKLDLVTSAPTVILGNGDGTFQSPAASNTYCYGTPAVQVADFNGDGKKDVMTLCEGDLLLSLGNGDGTLQSPIYENFGYGALSIATGDFNRDGIADIAFTSNPNYYLPASSEVTIMLGNGDGTFRTGVTAPVLTGQTGNMIAADFNDDGIVDLAVMDNLDAVFSILQGNGDGTFGAARIFGTATNPACMVQGRFRTPVRAGFPDLAFCTTPGVAVELNSTQ